METCKYTYDLVGAIETNNSYIGKKVIRVLDCQNNISLNELCGLWNYNKCPNDKWYCQQFVTGDIIYKQFITPRNYFNYGFIHLIDVATGEDIVSYASPLTYEFGYDKNDNLFSNIMIDTNLIDETKCFYIKIVNFSCNLRGVILTEFNDCVSALEGEGKTTSEAQETCLTNLCPDSMAVYYSEPYCKVTCENTILVQGEYPNYDCNGNFYGTFTSGSSTNSFIPQVRLFGTVEPTQFDIEETLINNKRKSAKRMETFLFRTKRIPYYVAQQLSNIFASKTITIDGVEYLRAINITKNNDEGSMWIVNSTLVQECDEINFTCDN